MFVDQALSEDWATIRARLEAKMPSPPVLATAAFRATDPEVRQGLLGVLAGLEHEGLLPVHRLALTGDVAKIADLDADQLDAPVQGSDLANNAALGRWTPSHIAAGAGHTEMLAALRDRGADLEVVVGNLRVRPLDVAVRYHQSATVMWLLEAGYRPTPCTPTQTSPGTPDAMLEALIASGMDLDEWAAHGLPGLTLHGDEIDEKLEFVARLRDHGLPLDAQVLHSLIKRLEVYDAEEIAVLIDGFLQLGDFDLDALVRTGAPEPADRSVVERALRNWPIDAVQRLVDAGASVPVLRIASVWPDAEEKRALLQALDKEPGEPALTEFMTLADDELTTERIVRLLAGPDMTIGGVALGTPEAEVQAALGVEREDSRGFRLESASDAKSRKVGAKHEMYIWLDAGRVTKVAYNAFFANKDDARDAFEGLGAHYREALGKPKGRKDLSWQASDARLALELTPQQPWHVVTLSLEPA